MHCTRVEPYALQDGTLLCCAALRGLTTFVEHLLSTPGIDVDTAFQEIFKDSDFHEVSLELV